MNLSGLLFAVSKPFMNLTPRARVLQYFRLFSGFISLVIVTVVVTGAFTNSRLYVNRLDCAHVDVSNGLFSMMRESVSSNTNSPADNYGSGMTASEIELLSEYTEKVVETCPQYITSNVFNWCFGNYNLTEVSSHGGDTHYRKTFTYQYCTHKDRNYVYDYRGELKTIGLNIILAYAYSDSSVSTTVSNDDYVPDARYLAKVNSRKSFSKTISSLLIFAGFADLLIIFLAIFMYGLRGYDKDDTNAPVFFRQFIPILSLIAFIAASIGVGGTTAMSINIRNEILDELGSFGISSHLGGAWFGMAWTGVGLHLANACAWGGPVWCGAPNVPIRMAGQDDTDYIGTPMFNRRAFKLQHKFMGYDSDDQETEEYEMTGGPSVNLFPMEKKTRDEKADPFINDDEVYDPFTSALQAPVPANKGRDFRKGLPKINNKRTQARGGTLRRAKSSPELNEDDFINSDIFLTEDDKFILKRENLLLDKKGTTNS